MLVVTSMEVPFIAGVLFIYLYIQMLMENQDHVFRS